MFLLHIYIYRIYKNTDLFSLVIPEKITECIFLIALRSPWQRYKMTKQYLKNGDKKSSHLQQILNKCFPHDSFRTVQKFRLQTDIFV